MAAQSLYPRFKELFTAANGQFMAFNMETYSDIGGHNAVRNEVVEDMALARRKRNNHSMGMFHGKNTVYCRMYHTSKEVWDGFGKNFGKAFPTCSLSFQWVYYIYSFSFFLYLYHLLYMQMEAALSAILCTA